MKFRWPRTPNEVTAARTAKDFSASTWRGSCSGTSRYYKDDSGALNLNDGIFSLPVEYAVNISTKQNDFQYANYRLVVTVSMYDKNNKTVTMPENSSLSDYVTYTVARVLKSF